MLNAINSIYKDAPPVAVRSGGNKGSSDVDYLTITKGVLKEIDKGKTQVAVAEIFNVSPSTVYKIVRIRRESEERREETGICL